MDLLPIENITVYRRDIVVKRIGESHDRPLPKRGDVYEFSYQSRRKLAFVAANTDACFKTMITLTYPARFPLDGATSKRQLRAFLQYCRRRDSDLEYLWFLEFQRRGAPHYHLLLTTVFSSFDLKDVSRRWFEIVGSGDDKHLRAGTRTEPIRSPDGGARYAVKYAMKMRQKAVPVGFQNCGRFWGHSRGVKPKPMAVNSRVTQRDLDLLLLRWSARHGGRRPGYKVLFGAADDLRKAVGWGED